MKSIVSEGQAIELLDTFSFNTSSESFSDTDDVGVINDESHGDDMNPRHSDVD